MREDWWLEVRKMLANGETNKEVTFKLPSTERDLLKKYATKNDKIKCRLVAVQLPEGGTEVLCSSIINEEILPYECLPTCTIAVGILKKPINYLNVGYNWKHSQEKRP